MTFEVIPSIDIKGGRCVRLYQGDYSKETIYSEDPVAMAERWASLKEKPPRLHLIDLDGAAKGELQHSPLIKEIASKVKIPVQVGGGIRSMEAIEDLFKAGVQYVILGTAAVEEPDLVRDACRQYGERIIVGVDARARQTHSLKNTPVSGHVAVRGWLEDASKLALDLVKDMMDFGVKTFIYTDIVRDGTLTQPNLAAIKELVDHTRGFIIASGGVTKLEDLKELARIGAGGAIIGRALYTGDIDLEKAIQALKGDTT